MLIKVQGRGAMASAAHRWMVNMVANTTGATISAVSSSRRAIGIRQILPMITTMGRWLVRNTKVITGSSMQDGRIVSASPRGHVAMKAVASGLAHNGAGGRNPLPSVEPSAHRVVGRRIGRGITAVVGKDRWGVDSDVVSAGSSRSSLAASAEVPDSAVHVLSTIVGTGLSSLGSRAVTNIAVLGLSSSGGRAVVSTVVQDPSSSGISMVASTSHSTAVIVATDLFHATEAKAFPRTFSMVITVSMAPRRCSISMVARVIGVI